jgi:hypothetical protein
MNRPSLLLKDYLDGADAPESVKSWARFYIYKEAVRILALPLPARKTQIEKYGQPELLKAEVLRVDRYRKANNGI